MIVVSNASPILNLAIVRQTDLLVQLYGGVVVPDAVIQELTAIGSARPEAAILQALAGVARRTVANRSLVNSLLLDLDPNSGDTILNS